MLIKFFFSGTGIMQITLAVTAKFFNSFIWVSQPLMLAEMSPTTVRNLFCGTVQFFGNLGAIAAPYLPLIVSLVYQTINLLLHYRFHQ